MTGPGGEEERRGERIKKKQTKTIKKDRILSSGFLGSHTYALSAGPGGVLVLVWVRLVPAGAGGARHAAAHHRVGPHLTGQAHLGQLLEVDTCGPTGVQHRQEIQASQVGGAYDWRGGVRAQVKMDGQKTDQRKDG